MDTPWLESYYRNTIKALDGNQLIFHDPFEVPSKYSSTFYTAADQMTRFLITPELITYDESFTDYSLEERGCFLKNERKLKFFKVYNRANCEHECLSEMMAVTCNCVKFFMIRNKSTRVCGLSDEKCFTKVDQEFDNKVGDCNCLQPCEMLKYTIEKQSFNFEL
jgi:acid-sensing ion channel, other